MIDTTAKLDWNEIGRFAADVLAVVGGSFVLAKIGATTEQVQQAVDRVTARPDYQSKRLRAVVMEVLAETMAARAPTDGAAERSADEEAREAARLLGIAPDADADEIRAALRAKLADSRLHPDHGGDAEGAKELIAAKNLLIQRLEEEKAR